MRIREDLQDLAVNANVALFLRERGKLIGTRIGHNVFTVTGRNLLSKLISWHTIASVDIPYTHRRVRWFGVGSGSQLEVTTVSELVQPVLAAAPNTYLVPVQSVEFPTSTSVRFIKEFGLNEITISSPVIVTEAGLFADVSPGDSGAVEDEEYTTGGTTLNPEIGTNAPIAYKAFEGLTKTVDFTLEIQWEFRF